ncbi:MAG: ORF6N domain-containing protein [Nanoarchaeota archaeon]
MANNSLALSAETIRSRIYTIRGMQVILDKDLAELYVIETRALKQAVNRNIKRFPPDFMFVLTEEEAEAMVSQNVIPSKKHLGGALPYAFTEQGVANLASILKNNQAIEMNIQVMRAFVAMRRFISANALVFQRLDVVERKQIEHDKKFDEIFDAIQSKGIEPEKGIFFDGQVFDAYRFVSGLVRSAEKSIVLIDNYIDDSVLTLFSKRNKNVQAVILTKEISKQLLLDLEKHNSQYPLIEIREFKLCHDRFLIIDNKDVYHFGASLKDLGKKWFAFCKFGKEALDCWRGYERRQGARPLRPRKDYLSIFL